VKASIGRRYGWKMIRSDINIAFSCWEKDSASIPSLADVCRDSIRKRRAVVLAFLKEAEEACVQAEEARLP
jgi:hypothetical protein